MGFMRSRIDAYADEEPTPPAAGKIRLRPCDATSPSAWLATSGHAARVSPDSTRIFARGQGLEGAVLARMAGKRAHEPVVHRRSTNRRLSRALSRFLLRNHKLRVSDPGEEVGFCRFPFHQREEEGAIKDK